ncbi:MAG: hypothetical protein AAFP69_05855 [Planctomycetota bacterium]
MLREGTHRSPDGEVVVTADRLQRWARTFAAMTANGQVIPMHWDHSTSQDELVPVPMSVYQTKDRSAKTAIGRMIDFQPGSDERGAFAEIKYEVRDEDAVKKFDQNTVQVSPVIFERWSDGGGNQYTDPITHLDAVVHPVDHGQSPAERIEESATICCGIRMGLSPKVYRLGKQDEEPATKSPDSTTATPTAKPDESGPSVKVTLKALASLGLTLPPDTNESNFLERVHTAAIAAAGADPMSSDTETEVAEPQVDMLSLNAKQALAFGERAHRKEVQRGLDQLKETGRCTVAEHKDWSAKVPAVKLSLNDQGEPAQSEIEMFITSRESIPEGTFLTEGGSKLMSNASPSTPPADLKVDPDGSAKLGLSDDRKKAAKASLQRK